ncbi:multidrug ABC transporter ATP-binding protein [Tenuibacillus multivorans]|nr:ABC transporter ATP-binding protein [Tenuibacillus multivorans]GEL77781.1 multidrug ABC transporter ATP-binding protein [Tenuibacillus multivorans]
MKILNVSIDEAGYSQDEVVIHGINFDIKEGELIGLIGPNGAGKSTTIKSILGTLENVVGTIQFQDQSMRYAYIPEQPVFYEELTLWEHIQFTASICELTEQEMTERAKPLLEIFRLDDVIHQLPSTFSKGMQQKLMIILAFLTKPNLYIIDEPFVGLDPKAMNDFLRLLNEEREQGAAVLMSTHMLDTAERICDRFLLIMKGSIIAQGTLADIRNAAQVQDANLFDSFEALMERT